MSRGVAQSGVTGKSGGSRGGEEGKNSEMGKSGLIA